MSRWIVAVVGAAICWTLAAMPFANDWSQIQMAKDLGLNFVTLFAAMGAVFFMFPFVQMWFLAPLKEALDERTRSLESTYADAENLKQHMADLKTSYEQKLAQSEAEAREKIQAALAEAQQMKEQILNEARNQAEEIRERTKEDMERERQKMLVELRAHVVDLTFLVSEKVIHANLDDERQRKLIGDFIEKAEVGA